MGDVEAVLRGRLASLSLEQKARLPTGADFCSLHQEPATFDLRVGRSSADLATAVQVAVPAPGSGTSTRWRISASRPFGTPTARTASAARTT